MKSVESTYGTMKAGAGAVISALVLALVAVGCGSSSETPSSVSGVVASDTSSAQGITLRDSSSPAQTRDASVDASGAFKVDVSGLTAPYLVEAKDDSGTSQYALATSSGSTNVNGLSDAVVRAASDDDDRSSSSWSYRVRDVEDLVVKLRTVLAPLFQHYGVTFGDDMEDSAAYRTMLSEVSFTVANRTLMVKNRATGAVIYSAALSNLTSGVLHPETIPGGTTTTPPPPPPPTTTTPCTYTTGAFGTCQSNGTQTRTVTASPSGCVGTPPASSQSCTYQAPACSYTYSAFGSCQSDGTQTRTLLSTTPSVCTGTPALSQSCTYQAQACSYTYSAFGSCQSNGTQTRTLLSTTPSVCTGAPALSQSCTYQAPACSYTYSAFGSCQSDGTQTRTLLSTTPSVCTGTPTLSQSCTYQAPACTYTVGAWGTCSASGQQIRTVTASPSGCTGTPPASSQSCAPPAQTWALYNQYCAGCHGTSKQGASAAMITTAINGGVSAMSGLSSLSAATITALAAGQ